MKSLRALVVQLSKLMNGEPENLAYPVDKKRNGYYVNLYFEGPGTMIPRIERALTIDDNMLRSLILAMDKSMIAHYHENKQKKQAAVASDTEKN